jgi:hypothetical protein
MALYRHCQRSLHPAKDFGEYAERVTKTVKAHVEELAEESGGKQ